MVPGGGNRGLKIAKSVKEAKLETKAARSRLVVGEGIHWKMLQLGKLHLGYKRRRADVAGVWVARRFVGKSVDHSSGYVKRQIGLADDFSEANGSTVLSFTEAEKVAHGTPTPPWRHTGYQPLPMRWPTTCGG